MESCDHTVYSSYGNKNVTQRKFPVYIGELEAEKFSYKWYDCRK